MQQITINEFEGTTSINVPKGVAYISIEGYSGVPTYHYEEITDSCMYNVIENANFNTIILNSDNFETSQFPLILTTFSDSDISGGAPLFGRPLGIPIGSTRIATGKRHSPCKNITFDDFSNYVNTGGSEYVTTSFDGLDYDIARENLNVYSKKEIDSLENEYEYTNIKFDMAKTDTLRTSDTATGYPFMQTPITTQTLPSRINCHNTFHSYFKKGMCGFEITFQNVKSYSTTLNGVNPCFFSDIQGIFNGRQFTTQVPLIIKPVVKSSNGTLPIYYRRRYHQLDTMWLTDAFMNTEGQFPVMVITPDHQINFATYTLNANAVYFIDILGQYMFGQRDVQGNYVFGQQGLLYPAGVSWYDSTDLDDVKYNFSYVCSFVPNDPQLN